MKITKLIRQITAIRVKMVCEDNGRFTTYYRYWYSPFRNKIGEYKSADSAFKSITSFIEWYERNKEPKP